MAEAIAEAAPSLSRKTPRLDEPELVLLLLSISRVARILVGMKLAGLGLYNGQDEMLIALQDYEAISVAALAERLSVRPSTVSKMLDRLGDLGMTEREHDKHDARRVLVRITPTGVKVRRRVLEIRRTFEEELHSDLAADSDRTAIALNAVHTYLRVRLRRSR